MTEAQIESEMILVGIGASAGGLEALQLFVGNLKSPSRMSFIIAQHLDPNQPTMLGNLLSKSTHIPITEATEGERPVENHIYICPPNRNITIHEGKFLLTVPDQRAYPKPSINIFFASLAREKEEKAIGIILSGTGSDGADGIRAIKNAGGITMAQTERTAKYSSMPRAAIETGHVDIVLSPDEIASELPRIVSSPGILKKELAEPKNLETIYDILLDRTGTDFTDYKISTIQRRIERRMNVNKLHTLEDYVDLLQNSSRETNLLYKDFLIIVTSFFRDPEAFATLKETIAQIVNRKEERETIRIWVPGCATGEEAYSIAILIHEAMGVSPVRGRVQIFATDVSKEAIESARKALFPKETISHLDKELVDRYFVTKDDHYEIVRSLRELVIFSQHDLIKDPPFLKVDLISCRNLLIYFNIALQKRIISIFHHALRQDGYLFLGKSESISNLTDLFSSIDNQKKIFRKERVLNPPGLETLHYFPRRYPHTIYKSSRQRLAEKTAPLDLDHSISQTVTSYFGKHYIVLNRMGSIIYTSGDVNHYLSFPSGNMTLEATDVVLNELRLELRAALTRSHRDHIAVTSSKIKIHTLGHYTTYVTMTVLPLDRNDSVEEATLVLFSEETKHDIPGIETDEERNERLYELEQELMATRERLQTTIEELETSNEELQATNEELQSSNEELQSTNEELETSNEELQSTNEELQTVNEELRLKSTELIAAYDELEDILQIVDFGLLLIDQNFQVLRFTPLIKKFFNIHKGDTNPNLLSLEPLIEISGLKSKIQDVISSSSQIQFELQQNENNYWCKILPTKSDSPENRNVAICIYDITETKKMQIELENYKNILEKRVLEQTKELDRYIEIIDQHIPFIRLNLNGEIYFASKAFLNLSGYTESEIYGIEYKYLLPDQERNHPDIEDHLFHDDLIQQTRVHLKIKNDTTLAVRLELHPEKDAEENTNGYLLLHSDISDQLRVEELNQSLDDRIQFEVAKNRRQEEILIQQSKMAAMGEMLGAIAHQWRQPLNIISISLINIEGSILQDHPAEGILKESLDKIRETLRYMSKTIDDFRNFFRPSKEKALFSVEEAIHDTISMIGPQIINHGIRIEVEGDKASHIVPGYPNEFKQALVNIIYNASEAVQNRIRKTPDLDGWIRIHIAERISNPSQKKQIQIVIEDNGAGVPETIRDRIFEPYFTTKFESQGTGLGLHMARTIIESSMGGSISLEARNQGTAFVILLNKE